jgi:tetratricopeptide (TPR) repeat protein
MNESFHQTKAQLAYLIKKVLHTKHSESFEYTITKTTMQAMDIITLNADAIDLMQQGNFQDAIPVFRVALRELHDRLTDDQKQDMDLAEKVTRTFLPVRSVPLEDTLSLLQPPSFDEDHHAFCIYDRALLIDSTDCVAVSSMTGQLCTAAALLFNMGLAYQLLGMQDLRSRKSSFNKAMAVYQMATDIFEHSDGDEVNGLTYLAVSNNMGHIYSHFCETRETQQCLDSLLEGLHSFPNIDTRGDEYFQFRMNLLVQHGQAAAAAA